MRLRGEKETLGRSGKKETHKMERRDEEERKRLLMGRGQRKTHEMERRERDP